MTKISNRKAYSNEDPISENDFLVGTDGDSEKKATKSFSFWNIREFVNQGLSPEVGGTLAITELVYVGPLTTPEAVVNQLVPNKTILSYEVFIISVNGSKYICAIQDRVVGDTQPPTDASDYISLGIEDLGLQKVLNPVDFISGNYTLTDLDNNNVIFINNDIPVTITLNTSISQANFSVGFIQEGSEDVDFITSGVTLQNPIGTKIKGFGYQAFIERKLNTTVYYLLGNTKA